MAPVVNRNIHFSHYRHTNEKTRNRRVADQLGGTIERTRALLLGIATGLGLIAGGAPAQAEPPKPYERQVIDVPVGYEFGECAFPVQIVATGKFKEIETPKRTIIVAGATLLRLSEPTGTRKSVEYKINGSFHNTTDAGGNVTTKATGQNILTDPEAGVVVTSGNFTFTFTGTEPPELVKGLSGTGQTIDVCAALA